MSQITKYKNTSTDLIAKELTISNGDWVVDFITLNYKELLSKNNGKKTSRQYISCAYPFIAYIQENGFDFSTVSNFRKELDNHKTKAASTLSGYYNSAKQILKSVKIYRPDLIHPMIYDAMVYGVKPVPVSSDHVKNGINQDEFNLVLDYLESMENIGEKKRLKAMLALLAFQALRQFEVAKIHMDDLSLIDATAMVKGKHGSHCKIHLSQPTVQAIDEYCRYFDIKSGYLFTSNSHQKSKTGHLSERSVRRFWKNIFIEIGISDDKTTHGFRHYCLTKIAEITRDVFKVRDFGRLKSLETAKKYVDLVVNKEDIKEYEEHLNFAGNKIEPST